MIVEKDITTQSHLPNFTESTISAADMAKTLEIIANIYSKPKDAVLRELVANGIDSHRVAGTTDPVIVTMPSKKFPEIIIADTGTGLSLEECENIYGNYMRSTKRDTNDAIGHFGMGSKSPYSVTNQFSVEAVKDGKLTVIIFGIHPDTGAPGHSILASVDTDRVNGLTVKIPVDTSDEELQDWYTALDRVSYYWSEKNVAVKTAPLSPFIEQVKRTHTRWDTTHTDPFYQYRNHYSSEYGFIKHDEKSRVGYSVRMGPIGYNLPPSMGHIMFTYVILTVPMGALTIDPSRENIKDTAENKAVIKRYTELFLRDVASQWKKEFSEATTLLEAYKIRVSTAQVTRHLIQCALQAGIDVATGFDHIDAQFELLKEYLPTRLYDPSFDPNASVAHYLQYSTKRHSATTIYKDCVDEFNLGQLLRVCENNIDKVFFVDVADIENYTAATARTAQKPRAKQPVYGEELDRYVFLKNMTQWLSPAPRIENIIKKWVRYKNAEEPYSVKTVYVVEKSAIADIADPNSFSWVTISDMNNELTQVNNKAINLAKSSASIVNFDNLYHATYNAFTRTSTNSRIRHVNSDDSIRTVHDLVQLTEEEKARGSKTDYTATIVIGTIDEFNTIPSFMNIRNWSESNPQASHVHNDYFVSSSGRSQATWAELVGTAVKPWLTLLTVEEFKQREMDALENRYTSAQWVYIAHALELVRDYGTAASVLQSMSEIILQTATVATNKSVKVVAEDFAALLPFISEHSRDIDKLRQNIPLVQHILPKPTFTQALPTTTAFLKNLGYNRDMPADVLIATITADLAVIRKAKRRLPRLAQ